MKRHLLHLAVAGILAQSACASEPSSLPKLITIPGEKLTTESLTSTADGTVIVSSMGPGIIFRARPGSAEAAPWIAAGTDGLANLLGVLADERSNTLWVCSFTLAGAGSDPKPPSHLHAFELDTGKPRARWALPTAGGLCNDIAIGPDGTAYVTDTESMEILRLAPGASSLTVWAGEGAFGPKGDVLDGIAILRGHVIVNALVSGRMFSVPIGRDGKAGPVAEIRLDSPLTKPDGQRAFGDDSLLLVDAADGGRLLKVTLSGEHLTAAKVEVLRKGFANGPTAVTLVGKTAYVLEAQFRALDHPLEPTKPYTATAVTVGTP